MEFEENVEMYYLTNKLFSDKANFVNSENYFVVQGNVLGEGPLGNVAADKLNVDLIEKNKISMYNNDKVNISKLLMSVIRVKRSKLKVTRKILNLYSL